MLAQTMSELNCICELFHLLTDISDRKCFIFCSDRLFVRVHCTILNRLSAPNRACRSILITHMGLSYGDQQQQNFAQTQ